MQVLANKTGKFCFGDREFISSGKRAMDRKILTFYLNRLSIYGASKADLVVMDCFLTRCHKRNYITDKLSIYGQSDRKLYDKTSKDEHHPLCSILPTVTDSSQRLRRNIFQLPLVNTERFMNCFVNRLCFNKKLSHMILLQCNF